MPFKHYQLKKSRRKNGPDNAKTLNAGKVVCECGHCVKYVFSKAA